jgi:hypothetical protein
MQREREGYKNTNTNKIFARHGSPRVVRRAWDSLFFAGLIEKESEGRWVFFCNLNFSSEDGIFVTMQPQNDVVLPIPSILMVLFNGGGQIVRNCNWKFMWLFYIFPKGFARGSPHSILLAFSQSYVEHDLRKNKIVVPFFC